MVEARATFKRFDAVAQRAETNLENLEGLTGPLGKRGDSLVGGIDRTIQNVDELLDQLVRFGQALNNKEGSIGRLLHEREFYDRLNRTASNLEELTRRLKPVLADIRTFTDKIARDPGQVGLKRALDKKPSGVGLKFPMR